MSTTDSTSSLPTVLVTLMKGVLYRDSNATTWMHLVELQTRVREYVALLGLELMLDEAEGYAYVRQRQVADDEPEIPRLVPRRQLGYHVSLLLALLRKKLAEHDAKSGEKRLVLSRDELVDMVRVYFPDTANEAKLFDRMETHINKVIELGFLRRMRGQDDKLEVERILKAFVDAQWLGELEERLARYREHGEALAGEREEGK